MDGYVDRGYDEGYEAHVDKILSQINDSHIACEIKKKISSPNNGCDVAFDSVLCWPQTPANTLAVLPCFSQLNGIHYDTRSKRLAFLTSHSTRNRMCSYTLHYIHEAIKFPTLFSFALYFNFTLRLAKLRWK